MIVGFHLTWTTYGQWFPNDPRGSWSNEVWNPGLREVRLLDAERKVTRPRPVPKASLKAFWHDARATLQHDTVWLNPAEIDAVGEVFAEDVASTGWVVRACAILSNHVHLAMENHRDPFEKMVNRLKGRSAQRVRSMREIPVAKTRSARVPIWTEGYWSRYINSAAQMENVKAYIRRNGFRKERGHQEWVFVTS